MVSKNKTTIANIISTIIVQGLAFFSGPIFSKLLGTSNYGVFSVYMTWVSMSTYVFSLRANGAIAQARMDFESDEQLKYQSSAFSLGTISYACFSIVLIAITLVLRRTFNINIWFVICGLAHGWGSFCIMFFNSKFIYEFEATKNCILSIIVAVSTIGLSIVLIPRFPSGVNYWGRIIGEAGTYFAVGVILAALLMIKGRTVVSKKYWIYTLPITLPMIFHSLAGVILNQSDRVMLQSMVDSSAAGVYSLAYTFSSVVYVIWMALNHSWTPYYYEYTREGDFDSIRNITKNYLLLFSVIASGFILLSKEVFRFYAAEDFWSGGKIIPLLVIGFYFIFLYSFPSNFEFYHKKTKIVATGTIMAAIANVIFNYIFIRFFNIIGAVIATVLADVLQFVFHWILGRRIDRSTFPFLLHDFVPGYLMVCFACALFYLCDDAWMIRWIIGAILGIFMLFRIVKRREIF